MFNRKKPAVIAAYCLAASIAMLTATWAAAQVAPQSACPSCPQNTQYPCPGQCPGPTYAQKLCNPYRCCDNCTPNFMYWGAWPKTWQQWPQSRPDLWFPQGQGKEVVPTPQGTVPEKLPQEEPFVSPTAPDGGYLPPIGEGPATGPGDSGAPLDLNQGFEQGQGFDQGLPAMDNLPSEPPAPESLPIKGVEDSATPNLPATQPGTEPPLTEPPLAEPPATEPPAAQPPAAETPAAEPPAATPPAAEPPATSPPAAETPAPGSGSADKSPAESILSRQPRPASHANAAADVEKRPAIKTHRQAEKKKLSPLAVNNSDVPQTSDINPSARMPKFEPVEENPYEPIAPEPGDTCLTSVAQSASEPLHVDKAFDSGERELPATTSGSVVRRTTFETKEAIEPLMSDAVDAVPEAAEERLIPDADSAPVPTQGVQTDRDARQPVGLDGYCPVELVHNESWAQGDSRYAVEFEGRTYLMSGPEQHRAFRSNPERYAPVNAGFDPVLSFEENVRRDGRTDACAVFEGRLYMFAGPDSLARFQSDPNRYTRALKQAQR